MTSSLYNSMATSLSAFMSKKNNPRVSHRYPLAKIFTFRIYKFSFREKMSAGTFKNKLKASGIRNFGKDFQQLAAPATYIWGGGGRKFNILI